MTQTQTRYRVNVGYSLTGRTRWRTFNSLAPAQELCNRIFKARRIVLAIEAVHPIVHWRSIGLRNNAGMDFPACYASAGLLDCDKGRLPSTGDRAQVTCKRCQRLMEQA